MQPAPAADDSLVGFVLADKYRVVRQIGRGGMGIVYEAEHVGLGKRVAIKLMLEKYAEDLEAIARFQREALAASRIGNPHIIDVSDIGTAPDGRSFVVMELLTGSPLSQVIQAAGALPPWRAIHIMRQVLRAVGAAHAKGIIHRDLKPDNIFIVNQDDHHDFVKLLDFGISKMVDPDEQMAFTKLTTTGVVMGTPLYMAPEQAMGYPIERYADLYACGVILYEMLAGRPPFEGATYAVLIGKLLTATAPHLDDLRPGLPPTLVRAVHHALEKEPAKRFQSAEQFAAALPGERTPSNLELAGTLDSSRQIAPASMRTLGGRRRWPWVAGIAAFVLAGAVAATIVILQADGEPPAATTATASAAPATSPVESVTPAAPQKAAAPAVPAVGILQIKSVPSGASVSIDGDPVGITPLEITLAPKRYRIQVALAGHDTIESDEEVRAERASVVLQLQKSTGATQIRKEPTRKITRKTEPLATPPVRTAPRAIEPKVQPKIEPTGEPRIEPRIEPKKPPAGTKPNPY